MLKLHDSVRVINFRHLAFNRTGIVISLSGSRKNPKTTIRFSDLPQLSPRQLKDETGLTASFDANDLEQIEPLDRELIFHAIQHLTAQQTDTIINRIRESAKSHHATRYSIQVACQQIYDLGPSYTVDFKADNEILLDYVDTALISLCLIRDELEIKTQKQFSTR